MLTIEKSRLGDLWLPCWRKSLKSLRWLEKREPRDNRAPAWDDWWHVRWTFQREVLEVEERHIIERGGLLLLVP